MSSNNQVIIVRPNIHVWYGSKTAKPEEVGIDPNTLPPPELLSFGSKHLFPREKIGYYTSLKGSTGRALAKLGVAHPCGIGYVIPPDSLDEALSEIEGIKKAWYEQKAIDFADFDVTQEAFAQANPNWAHLIRGDSLKQYFHAQLHYDYHVFTDTIVKVEDPRVSALIERTHKMARDGIFGRLINETVRAGASVFQALHTNERVTSRTPGPLVTLAAKLRGLAFFDARLQTLWIRVKDVLNELPEQGTFTPDHIDRLESLLVVLKDHDELCRRLDAGEEIVAPVEKSTVAAEEEQLPLPVLQPVEGGRRVWR